MTLRLCFVGYGAIAREHAEIFRAEDTTLEIVVGRVPEETAHFASEFGFREHTTDLDSALANERVDAVIVASPSALHYEQARRALLAGKHVLVEIPLAMTYAEGLDLVRLAEQQRRCLMVAHSQRYIPPLAALRQKVVSGSLHVYHLIGRFGIFRRQNVGWTGRPRSWTDNLLWHHACHLVDFSLWFLDASRADVLGQVAAPDARTGIPMDLDLLLRTPAGAHVSLSLSYHTHMTTSEYLIIGEEDTVRFDQGRVFGADGLREDLEASGPGYLRLSWQFQDREFLAALREGRTPATSGADALPALAILQEVQDRLITGRHEP